jgi:TPR repeat protein
VGYVHAGGELLMKKRFRLVSALLLASAVAGCGDFDGRVVPVKRAEPAMPIEEMRGLAEQGDAAAQYKLGVRYDRGQGVSQDYQEALHWYRLAAAQGHSAAQYNLCMMSDVGQGLPQDYLEALRWCRLAADQGQGRAMYNLGLHYQKGQGVLPDVIQAHKWYNLAAAAGYEQGAKMRDRLAKDMTPAQVAEAHRLAREWKPATN